nr:proteoglycan 4 isoform X2 [Onthophagus taurus]
MSVFVNQRIDFNNPMMNKPTNLQNSAVLRMLEEEENRKRSGQPGSLKRVAWPPPEDNNNEEFVEQPAVQAQGGPINPQKTTPGPQIHHIPIQQSQTTPGPQTHHIPIQQNQTTPQIHNIPIQQNQTREIPIQLNQQKPPTPQFKEDQKLFTSSATFQPVSPPPSSPLLNKSPTDFSSLAKPWSPQLSPSSSQYRSVSPSTSSNVQSFKSSKVTEYTTTKQYQFSSQSQSESQSQSSQKQFQSQPIVQSYSTSSKETSFEQQPSFNQQSSFQKEFTQIPVFKPAPPPEFKTQTLSQNSQPSKLAEKILTVKIERAEPEDEEEIKPRKPITPKKEESKPSFVPKSPDSSVSPQTYQEPSKTVQFVSQNSVPINSVPQSFVPQNLAPQNVEPPKVNPPKVTPTPPQKVSSLDQLAPSQQGTPQPQRTLTKPKPVEPPPSTITLRPQAPVSQAPPPLVNSQPATAKFGGGKNLRGDLKWPPEEVKEKMAAEKQHLLDLAKGPACRPKKQHKDYMPFFAKHQLNSTYPGYKIPPGTQFYDHNPVM